MFDDINKKYGTIVIDPPWNISMTGRVKIRENRAEKLPYKTMSNEEIKKIPLKDIADIGCHVYCWTTNKMLRETFDVFDAWGVNFHLCLVWTKPTGLAPCFAYKFATEYLLLGFFGKPMKKFIGMGKLNHLQDYIARNHSAKPDSFYKLIETMSPEPRIDIFARKRRVGWDAFGDEIKEFKYCCFSCEHETDNIDDNCGCHSQLIENKKPEGGDEER